MLRGYHGYKYAWLPAMVLLFLFLAAAHVASAGAPNDGSINRSTVPPSSGGGNLAPDSPGNDAFLELVPAYNAPDNGGAAIVGQRFVLELWVNSGSHTDLTSLQAYMTFTQQTLQNVRADRIETTCTPSTGFTGDYTTFDASLQNEVCNGPSPCRFRSISIFPGSISFSSAALFKCHEGCAGTFRVAEIGLCAAAPGPAAIRWQFDDKGIGSRDTQIIDYNNRQAQNRFLFTDYTIEVVGGTLFTPNPIATPPVPTSSPTRVPESTQPPYPTNGLPPALTHVPAIQPDCLNGFLDVGNGDFFSAAVRNLYCLGSLTGYADGTFRPYDYTSRGQLAKIVVLASGWTVNMGGGPHFVDTPAGSPFYGYIETASNRGIITGYSDGTFRWSDHVTRGQLCKVIALSQRWDLVTAGGPHFSDVSESNPFYAFVETAFNHGTISGYSDGTFRPGNNATRGQISVIAYRALTSP